MKKGLHFILVVLTVSSCLDNPKKSSTETCSTGQYANGREVGLWIYKTDNGSVIEEGNFDQGVRVGMWKYYFPRKDSIVWIKFSNISGSILTNIPELFILKDNYDSLVYFEYSDSSKIFNLVIGSDKSLTIFNLEQYENQLYKDLKNVQFQVLKATSQKIKTESGRQYIYHRIFGRRKDSKDLVIYNIAEINNNKFFEISVRAEPEFDEKAKTIFFSIIPNLFMDSSRFINQKDIITSIKGSNHEVNK